MSVLIALILALAPIAPICGFSVRSVQIVFVVPPGEQLTDDERVEWVQAAYDGVGFWQATYVLAPVFRFKEPRIVNGADLVYANVGWSIPYVESDGTILLAIIDNSASGRLYLDRLLGVAIEEWNAAYVVGAGSPNLAASIAHELGHAVFHLSDVSTTNVDIMGSPWRAYDERTIGCESMASLGMPCRMRVILP